LSVRRLHKQEKIQTEIKIIAQSIGFFSASASIVDFELAVSETTRLRNDRLPYRIPEIAVYMNVYVAVFRVYPQKGCTFHDVYRCRKFPPMSQSAKVKSINLAITVVVEWNS